MSELSRETDALLQQGRDGEAMSSHDRTRLKRALLAQVAGASVVATTTSAAAWTTVAAKVVGVVVLVGSVAGAVAVLPGRTPDASRAVARAPVPVTRASVTTAAKPTAQAPLAEPIATPPVPVASPPALPARATRVDPALAPATTAASARTALPPSSLEQEAALLHDADDALKAGEGGRALRLLDEHGARFPGSLLSPERAAERVFALCLLGRQDEAEAGARDFLREQSVGPLAARVRASCGGSGGR